MNHCYYFSHHWRIENYLVAWETKTRNQDYEGKEQLSKMKKFDHKRSYSNYCEVQKFRRFG